MNKYIKDDFCSYCGQSLYPKDSYPKSCKCGNTTWSNPKPVVVVMIPIIHSIEFSDKIGILIQQRNIDPQKGKWALPGGFINEGETWESAAVREIKEEIGIETFEEDYKLLNVKSGNNNKVIIIFCKYNQYIIGLDSISFKENDEVMKIDVMWNDMHMDLAFPSHTEESLKFIKTLNRKILF